jgi:hypothetical protein
MPVLCLTTLLALPLRLRPTRFALAAGALSVVSSFSLAAGLLVWVAALPYWIARCAPVARTKSLLAWALGFGASVAAYLAGYATPDRSLARFPSLGDAGFFGEIFFGILGYPTALAWGKGRLFVNLAFGIAAVAAFALLALTALRRSRPEVRTTALAWTTLGLFALLAVGLVTLGRAGGGIGGAFVSRYNTFSVYLWIAVLVLALLVAGRRGKAVLAVLGVAAVAWAAAAGRDGRDEMEARFWRMSRGKVMLVLAPLFPDQAHPDYLGFAELPLVDKARRLAQLGWLRPETTGSRRIDRLARIEEGTCGALEEAYPDRQRVRLLGYALLPDPRLADAVLLTSRSGREQAVVFAWATGDGRSRPELARSLRCPSCVEAGWEATIRLPERALPAVVEAWAYDVRHGRACRLEGSYRVDP